MGHRLYHDGITMKKEFANPINLLHFNNKTFQNKENAIVIINFIRVWC